MATSQTIALLFTDLVGSTALSTRIGAAETDRLRREYFGVLREAIDSCGGEEVKSLGDGLMVSFVSVRSAVTCAVGMQQGIEHRNRSASPPLAVRMGLAVGDALPEEQDWYGRPVIEAARLCDAAGGGQILVTESVRLLGVDSDGPALRSVGPLELKGLPERVPAWSVEWEPLRAGDGAPPLPARLRGVPTTGFVGRVSERDRLAAAWAAARDGNRRVVLVSGEPGIGKTRLAADLAADAHRSEAIVLYGRSDEDAGAAYQPWREALAHLVETIAARPLRRHADRHGGDLALLAPALHDRLDGLKPERSGDPETERYLLFEAVVSVLEEAAREAPVLLILDDLHWAGRPTLALLRHVQVTAPQMRLLVVATHRTGLPAASPLMALLGDLRREADVERIALRGLAEAEVVAFMEAVAGHDLDEPSTELARDLRRETDGNPFFLVEMLRHLVESGAIRRDQGGRWTPGSRGAALPLPESLHEIIGGRVARLGPDVERVVRIAAVIGRDFDLDLLTRVAGNDDDTVLDALDAAEDGALVAEAPERPGHFTFVHALVGNALNDALGGARRARLHERIASAIEERLDTGATVDLGELASHWAAASGPAAEAKALRYAEQAARQALAELAPDEAVAWFTRALDLHRSASGGDEAQHRELLLGLGEAQLQAGWPEFRETLLGAADLARSAGDGDRLVRAALANSRGYFSAAGLVDEERVAVLESALAEAAPDDPRRARLLALLGAELLWAGDHARRRALSDEALAAARAGAGSEALAHVLTLRITTVWSPQTLSERLQDTAELVALAEALDDPVQRFWALVWRAVTVAQAGDLAAADRCLTSVRALVERLGQPRLRFVFGTQEAWRAQLAGRLEAAEQGAEATATLGLEAGEPDALSLYVAQLAPIRWQQARLGEMRDLLEQIAQDVPAVSVFCALRAIALLEGGDELQATALLHTAARDGFAGLPADPVRLESLALWGDLAARLGEREAAGVLLGHLAPLRDQVLLDSLGAFGVVSHFCGLLAAALGRMEEADAHFAHALGEHERLEAASFAARTRRAWGEALRRAGRPGDAPRARDLLDATAPA